MEKGSTAFMASPSKENRQLMLKRPELPDSFQARGFKDSVRERVTGCGSTTAQFSDWLILRVMFQES